ncbi:MAG: T9SS type A sorting domain-containing protein, partial [Bacteroidota bacterium]
LFLYSFFPQLFSQQIELIYLEAGETIDACSSNTNCAAGEICYGLQYTPSLSGRLTSYTISLRGECINGAPPITVNESCTMTSNVDVLDGCAALGLFQVSTSGNSGSLSVVQGEPVIIHQICFALGDNSVNLFDPNANDPNNNSDASIDLPDGSFATEILVFANFTADNSGCTPPVDCANSDICSVDFGTTAGRLDFNLNANGNLVDGTSTATANEITQSFDVYDEDNEDCSSTGGLDDIIISTQLLSTTDINGNGIIDLLGGSEHYIFQESDGLAASIPMGRNADSESSSGDVRGYEIKVVFASHIGIRANQITANLSGVNDPGSAFETAELQFLGLDLLPYSTSTYQGFYNGTADLTGTCLASAPGSPWSSPGAGTVVFANTQTVNLSDPCNPAVGSNGTPNPIAINAATDAGLQATDFVRGFTLRVYGEDVAAPTLRDDGSGIGGEDAVAANRSTSTDEILVSKLLGYTVQGCVFEQLVLPVEWEAFTAEAVGKTALLEWSTLLEENHDRYLVEHRTDETAFTPIGEVRLPSSDLDGRRTYDFVHENPSEGVNYYQIRQLDFDGAQSTSGIRSVVFSGTSGVSFDLFPNPTTSSLQLRLPALAQTPTVQVFTAAGRLLFKVPAAPATRELRLPTDELPPGVYIVRVNESSRRFVKH